jgi:hypothetical protein
VKDEEKIIDVEFIDVDGTTKGGKRTLERIADIADSASGPVSFLDPEAAVKLQDTADIIRDADHIFEEAKPVIRRAGTAFEKMMKTWGLDDFNSRDVMKR